METKEYIGEIWRDIYFYLKGKKELVDCKGLFQVSNFGRVRSLNYRGRRGNIAILSQKESRTGYLNIVLNAKGKAITVLIHRLVAFAFPEICGDYFEGAEVNHLNENKKDNRAENLRWCTSTENKAWGHYKEKIGATQLNHPKKSKEVKQFAITGELIKKYPSAREAERQTGVDQASIGRCCNGSQSYAGRNCGPKYIWKFNN